PWDPIQQNLSLYAADDGVTEGDETFSIVLSDPVNGELGQDSSATITIRDRSGGNEWPPSTLTVYTQVEASVLEGNSVKVHAELSDFPEYYNNTRVCLPYSTSDGTAYSPQDFQGTNS